MKYVKDYTILLGYTRIRSNNLQRLSDNSKAVRGTLLSKTVVVSPWGYAHCIRKH